MQLIKVQKSFTVEGSPDRSGTVFARGEVGTVNSRTLMLKIIQLQMLLHYSKKAIISERVTALFLSSSSTTIR